MGEGEREKLVCECGGERFEERSPVKGYTIQTIDGSGDSLDHSENCFEYSVPKTVRCRNCDKRHPNPRFGRNDYR